MIARNYENGQTQKILTDSVLPEPVCAIPITFRPDKVAGQVTD